MSVDPVSGALCGDALRPLQGCGADETQSGVNIAKPRKPLDGELLWPQSSQEPQWGLLCFPHFQEDDSVTREGRQPA